MKKYWALKVSYFLCILQLLLTTTVSVAEQPSRNISLLKAMFQKVTVEKNDKLIPFYYSKDFTLTSNGKAISFDEFVKEHQIIYKTSIQYKVRYDEHTFIEQGNRVAGRLFITTKKPHEQPQEIEVILIAEYKDNKIYRLWELTYPDWSKMKAFKQISHD